MFCGVFANVLVHLVIEQYLQLTILFPIEKSNRHIALKKIEVG